MPKDARKKPVSVTLDQKLWEAAVAMASADERSLSWLVEKALIAYMESRVLRDDSARRRPDKQR